MKITIDVSSERIANLMVSFVESGVSNFWCSGVRAKPEFMKAVTQGPWYSDPKFYDQTFELQVIEDDADEVRVTVHTIDYEKMMGGLLIMAAKYPAHLADILSDDDDAATADLFVQCILFGEEKYA